MNHQRRFRVYCLAGISLLIAALACNAGTSGREAVPTATVTPTSGEVSDAGAETTTEATEEATAEVTQEATAETTAESTTESGGESSGGAECRLPGGGRLRPKAGRSATR